MSGDTKQNIGKSLSPICSRYSAIKLHIEYAVAKWLVRSLADTMVLKFESVKGDIFQDYIGRLIFAKSTLQYHLKRLASLIEKSLCLATCPSSLGSGIIIIMHYRARLTSRIAGKIVVSGAHDEDSVGPLIVFMDVISFSVVVFSVPPATVAADGAFVSTLPRTSCIYILALFVLQSHGFPPFWVWVLSTSRRLIRLLMS